MRRRRARRGSRGRGGGGMTTGRQGRSKGQARMETQTLSDALAGTWASYRGRPV